MPIDVTWHDNDETVILWTVGVSWTLEEFYQAHKATMTLLAGRTDGVSTIVDARAVISRPAGNLLTHFQQVLRQTPLDALVYVHGNGTWRFVELLINVILRVAPNLKVREIHFAESLDEAMALLVKAAKIPA